MTAGATDPWLADSQANARRLAAAAGFTSDPDLLGALCEHCKERNALPADKATCAHRAICEDCWPNGCPDCQAQVEADLQRRGSAVNAITAGAEQIHAAAWDLTDSDMGSLDWITRKVLLEHADQAIEALRRVVDVLREQAKKAAGRV